VKAFVNGGRATKLMTRPQGLWIRFCSTLEDGFYCLPSATVTGWAERRA
jgi:hypothetical protein